MLKSKARIELSPRLQVGVGRHPKLKWLQALGVLCVLASVVLAFNTGILLFDGNKAYQYTNLPAQVLGEQTQVAFIEHEVKKGDTIFSIAQEYKVDWSVIATLNNLQAPIKLKPGQKIKIPKI